MNTETIIAGLWFIVVLAVSSFLHGFFEAMWEDRRFWIELWRSVRDNEHRVG